MNGSPRSGTTASTRPRTAGASSSSRPSDRLAKMPGRRMGVELAGVPAGVVEGLRAARAGPRDRRHRPDHPAVAAVEGPRRGRDPAPLDARRRGGPGRGPGGGPAGDDRARRLPDRPARGDRRRSASRRSSTATSPPGPVANASKGGPPTVAEDRAGRPAPARLLGGRLGLPGRLHQHVRRRRRADAPPARACSRRASGPCRRARPA